MKESFSKTRAHQRYKLADGTPVPGVTTVLGILAKPALLHWAWECGMAGEDYRKTRDAAADVGTIAHWLIECHLRGVEPDTSGFSPADLDKAENAAIKFIAWWDAGRYELVAAEQQLVSERHRYGGTLDIVARRGGETVLVDIKTSKAIYPEYWRQVAAYGRLLDEPPAAYVICRIGKEASDGDFEVAERREVGGHWRVFLACLDAYNAIKQEGKG